MIRLALDRTASQPTGRGQKKPPAIARRSDYSALPSVVATFNIPSSRAILTGMPNRFKAWVALLLAIMICLVLVLPQVDLDDGVLKDGPTQLALMILLTLACALFLLFPPDPLHGVQISAADLAPPGSGVAYEVSILRC